MAKSPNSDDLVADLSNSITPEERDIAAIAGYGQRIGFGTRPALVLVDVTYGFCGRTPKPILQSIAGQRRSCGEVAWHAVERMVPVLACARAAKIPVIYSAMEDPASPEYEPGLWGLKNRRGIEDHPPSTRTNTGENQIVADIAPVHGEMVFAKKPARSISRDWLVAVSDRMPCRLAFNLRRDNKWLRLRHSRRRFFKQLQSHRYRRRELRSVADCTPDASLGYRSKIWRRHYELGGDRVPWIHKTISCFMGQPEGRYVWFPSCKQSAL